MKKFLFLAFVIMSCSPIYVPNLRNSPMFTKGGEFQASFQVGNGWEAQTAVSITKHIGVMGNFAYSDRTGVSADDENYSKHHLIEGGVGYFGNSDDTFYEVYAGYGKGEGSNFGWYSFLGTESLFATGKYERYFVQPGIGINKNRFQLSFVPRFSFVDFYEFSGDGLTVPVQEDPELFIEPAIIGRFLANHNLFFTFQAGTSLIADQESYFDHRKFQSAVGLGIRLGGAKPNP